MSFDLSEKNNDEMPVNPSSKLHVLIIAGSFDQPVEKARLQIVRTAFYGRIGWELKDCVAMGLPQHLRFELVRGMKRVVKYGIEGYILLI